MAVYPERFLTEAGLETNKFLIDNYAPIGSTGGTGGVVYWDSTTDTWPARPSQAAIPFGVLFLSTNDPAATAPSDVNLAIGDRWLRHPEAV